MWFLIKTAFWFSLVLVLLPIFASPSGKTTQNEPQVQVSDAVTAATGAFQYVTSICSEKPDVCVKGGQTLTALGYRAREGALVAYQMIDQHLVSKPDGKTAGTAGSSEQVASAAAPQAAASQADAEMQPMPPKPVAANDNGDAVFTGTVIHIPVPMRRPVL